jgi:acyl-CoA thioesterase
MLFEAIILRPMTIEELLGVDGDVVRMPEGWGNQWGTTFGGYMAAVQLHALERAVPREHSLSVAQVAFVRPLHRESDARFAVEVHRSGRTATAVTGRIEQDGETAAVGMAWATAPVDQPSRVEVSPPRVGPPEEYERNPHNDERDSFIDREFDMRPVPTPEGETLSVLWVRLTRLEIAADEPWPAGALGLIGDMVGAGPYRATKLTLDSPHSTLALDLTIHLGATPRGPWLLGVFDNVALVNGRATGRGEFYDQAGAFVANVTQQSVVRPLRR